MIKKIPQAIQYFAIAIFLFLIGVVILTRVSTLNLTRNSTPSVSPVSNLLEIPAEYFDEMNFVWGSDVVAYDGIFASRTDPRPVETELDYSNETRELEPKTVSEALKEFPFPEFEGLFKKIIEEYGSTIGGHYIGGISIIGLEEFDVNTDGEKEKIVHFMGTGGNHPPHGADIIKDGKIIFSVGLDGGGILESTSHNGFYVKNLYRSPDDGGYCCADGYNLFRFIYQGNKFVPIWEQRVDYLKLLKQ